MVNITFSPGNLSSLINIEIIKDFIIETNETFTLHLTSLSSGVLIKTPNATVTILDDDGMTFYSVANHRLIPRTPGALFPAKLFQMH